jgi:predicted ATP-dependent serine protease
MTTTVEPIKKKRIRTWSAQMIVEKQFAELELGEGLEGLIGKPSRNFCSIIFGKAKSGKSTFALELADKLSMHGKVLYVASEEMISKTLKDRLVRLKLTEQKNVRYLPLRDISDIERTIRNSHPKFIFIDSVQVCNLKLKEFMHLKNVVFKNRKSWHLISQATNSGKMMLPQGFVHETDVKIQLDNGIAIAEGRFNAQGHLKVLDNAHKLF